MTNETPNELELMPGEVKKGDEIAVVGPWNFHRNGSRTHGVGEIDVYHYAIYTVTAIGKKVMRLVTADGRNFKRNVYVSSHAAARFCEYIVRPADVDALIAGLAATDPKSTPEYKAFEYGHEAGYEANMRAVAEAPARQIPAPAALELSPAKAVVKVSELLAAYGNSMTGDNYTPAERIQYAANAASDPGGVLGEMIPDLLGLDCDLWDIELVDDRPKARAIPGPRAAEAFQPMPEPTRPIKTERSVRLEVAALNADGSDAWVFAATPANYAAAVEMVANAREADGATTTFAIRRVRTAVETIKIDRPAGSIGPAVDVVRWYDHGTRSHVVQTKDAAGNQIGDAGYFGTRREAIREYEERRAAIAPAPITPDPASSAGDSGTLAVSKL